MVDTKKHLGKQAVTTKKLILGLLSIILLSTGIITLTFLNVRTKIENTKSTFYISENGSWVISGIEYNKMYQGSTRILQYNPKLVSEFDEITKVAKVTRTANYGKAVIRDTYIFQGKVKDIEQFPVSHKIEVINGSGMFYQYELRKIDYNGVTYSNPKSPLRFGKKMFLEFPMTYSSGKVYTSKYVIPKYNLVYKSKYVILKYKLYSDYESYNIRLFDPSTVNLYLDGLQQNVNYELGSRARITYNSTDDTVVCLDIDHPDFGTNYSCTTSSHNETNITIRHLYFSTFNDSTLTNITSVSGSAVYIKANNISEFQNFTVNITGVNAENLTIRFGNSSNISYRLPGTLNKNLLLNSFTNGQTNESLNFPTTNYFVARAIEFPGDRFDYQIRFNVTGQEGSSNLSINFSDTTFKDTTATDSWWDTNNSWIVMTPRIKPWNYTQVTDSTFSTTYDYNGTLAQNTVYGAHDTNLNSWAMFDDLGCGTSGCASTATDDWTSWNVTNTSLLTLKYRLYCGGGSGGGGAGTESFQAYNWVTSGYDTINSKTCAGGDGPQDTGILTVNWNLSGSQANYKNSSNAILFRHNWDKSGGGGEGIYGALFVYSSSNANPSQYDIQESQTTTTLVLHTPPTNMTNLTFNSSTNKYVGGSVTLSLSINNGQNYETISYQNTSHQFNFTNNGNSLKARILLSTTNKDITPKVDKLFFDGLLGDSPTNLSVDFDNDNTFEFIRTGELNTTDIINLTTNLSTPILNKYLTSVCNVTATSGVGCVLDFVFYSTTIGKLRINDINITTSSGNGPSDTFRTLNITPFINTCKTIDCNIPLNVSFKSGTSVTLANPRLAYLGPGNISVVAHNKTYNNNQTRTIVVQYSNWNYTFPTGVDFFEFIPSTPTSKNVSPYGQTPTMGFFNITNKNFGSENMNFSVYLNESFSCVNLSMAVQGNASNATKLNNGTWNTVYSNKAAYTNQSLWLYADFGCNATSWQLWYPEISFRGCGYSSICSTDVN